jgi:hypothetical protein
MGLVGQDDGEADAAVVVDGDVQVLIARASGLLGAVAVDAMSGVDDPRQALDSEVDQVVGMGVLVTYDGRWRVEGNAAGSCRSGAGYG